MYGTVTAPAPVLTSSSARGDAARMYRSQAAGQHGRRAAVAAAVAEEQLYLRRQQVGYETRHRLPAGITAYGAGRPCDSNRVAFEATARTSVSPLAFAPAPYEAPPLKKLSGTFEAHADVAARLAASAMAARGRSNANPFLRSRSAQACVGLPCVCVGAYDREFPGGLAVAENCSP